MVGPGGACAPATSATTIIAHEIRKARFIAIQGNGLRPRRFRDQIIAFLEWKRLPAASFLERLREIMGLSLVSLEPSVLAIQRPKLFFRFAYFGLTGG